MRAGMDARRIRRVFYLAGSLKRSLKGKRIQFMSFTEVQLGGASRVFPQCGTVIYSWSQQQNLSVRSSEAPDSIERAWHRGETIRCDAARDRRSHVGVYDRKTDGFAV
jgi:hypothetical protein